MHIRKSKDQRKNYVLLALLEILHSRTDAAHPLTKNAVLQILETEYNIPLSSRSTLDKYFGSLTEAGYEIAKTSHGFYLRDTVLADADLLALIRCIRRHPAEFRNAPQLIAQLKALGSVSLREA